MTKEQMIVGFLRRCATIAETRFAMGLIESAEVVKFGDDGRLTLSVPNDEDGFGGVEFQISAQVSLLPGTRSDFVIVTKRANGVMVVEIDDPSHWRDEEKAAADRDRDLNVLARCSMATARITNAQAMDPAVPVERILDAVRMLDARAQSKFVDGWCAHRDEQTELDDRSPEPLADSAETEEPPAEITETLQ